MVSSTEITLLHDGARHYCAERIAQWQGRYQHLSNQGRNGVVKNDGSWSYSDEARATYPRFNVLAAILEEVERFVPFDFASPQEARTILMLVGETAKSQFTTPDNAIEAVAIAEERSLFIEFVRTAELGQLRLRPSLPFRRSLGEAEHLQLLRAFQARWGTCYGGNIEPKVPAAKVLTLHDAIMNEVGAYDSIRKALAEREICRVVELREHGTGYELDIALASFEYNGAEGFWTSSGDQWMVYASHESSISFGGSWLIEAARKCLPQVDKYLYQGWDLSRYNLT